MSKLVERAIDAAGLGSVLAARREGAPMGAHIAQLRVADLLALGALADRVRAEEVGVDVRIHMSAPPSGDMSAPPSGDMSVQASGDMSAQASGEVTAPARGDANTATREGVIVLPRDDQELTGLELLREVAIARITGARGAHVRIDWTLCGLELAQVALGFGADELVGVIATKRGLPIADGELAGAGKKSKRELAQVVKRKELAACVERGGRVAVYVRADGGVETAAGIATAAGVEADGEVEAAEPLKEAM